MTSSTWDYFLFTYATPLWYFFGGVIIILGVLGVVTFIREYGRYKLFR